MIDALGHPQRLLLLGGTSEIALAIARRYLADGPLEVVLAARPGERRQAAAADLAGRGAQVTELDLDALVTGSPEDAVARAREGGDLDVAVVAFGVLGDNERQWQDVESARELAQVNFVAAMVAGVALATAVREQGHGRIVALSSVAGERPRRSNFAYGATKAGFDAFYTGLGEALREHGGTVLVVRPGFVHSRMTRGLPPAPLATTPDAVAEATVAALAKGHEQVWVPAAMRGVMSGLRHLPRPVFRRLGI
jgi:decaprenylphospho-beta-D-erythro-pentofuranosid-2-ulose 2-reductase